MLNLLLLNIKQRTQIVYNKSTSNVCESNRKITKADQQGYDSTSSYIKQPCFIEKSLYLLLEFSFTKSFDILMSRK